MAATSKFTYFPVKGIGEPSRLLFAYLRKEYEDDRFKEEDWPKIKPTTPWGKTPVWDVDGQRVTQSIAIARYLGREAGLNGKDAWEDLRIDEIVDVINDLRAEMAKFQYEEDEVHKEKLKGPILSEFVPFYLKKLEAHVNENGGYLANGKLSWADFYFAGISDYLSFMNGSDITANNPGLKAIKEKVHALEGVKEWVEKRPETYC